MKNPIIVLSFMILSLFSYTVSANHITCDRLPKVIASYPYTYTVRWSYTLKADGSEVCWGDVFKTFIRETRRTTCWVNYGYFPWPPQPCGSMPFNLLISYSLFPDPLCVYGAAEAEQRIKDWLDPEFLDANCSIR